MNISAAVREYAVMQICQEFRTTWAGARLQLFDLVEAWPQTGLREQDLELALQELIGSGFFTGLPASPESGFVLSEVGAEMLAHTGLGLFGMDEYLRVSGALSKARRRVRDAGQKPRPPASPAAPGIERRAG
ncbi:MAG: hypothetical protein Q8Q73_18920 [Stagnimonas sp.]|nr:hypothetical protein [Stagnimonas sp.]